MRPWRPLGLAAVAAIFGSAPFRWCVAGGFAIDLAVGSPTRPHADIDLLISHQDHAAVRDWLGHWDCWQADPPGSLRPWRVGEALAPEVHDVWCRSCPSDRWRFQLMLDNGDNRHWVSRRSATINAPWVNIIRRTADGIPYLAAHVQLFYKAKSLRAKDEMDFNSVVEHLSSDERLWLSNAIGQCYGVEHRWIQHLSRTRNKP